MAQSIIVKLTDDMDGSEAEETIEFAIDGKAYKIDLSRKNAIAMRKAFRPYIEQGRLEKSHGGKRRAGVGANATLYSMLDSVEKNRFRAWANLPDARRISDERIQGWIDAGRP